MTADQPLTLTSFYLEAITACRYEIARAREQSQVKILHALLDHERELLRALAELPDREELVGVLPRVVLP